MSEDALTNVIPTIMIGGLAFKMLETMGKQTKRKKIKKKNGFPYYYPNGSKVPKRTREKYYREMKKLRRVV